MCHLTPVNTISNYWKRDVGTFRGYRFIRLPRALPRRYHYSSGMRDPRGYKDCQEWQQIERDEWRMRLGDSRIIDMDPYRRLVDHHNETTTYSSSGTD